MNMAGEKRTWMEQVRDIWMSFRLKQKIGIFAGTAIMAVLMSLVFNILVVNFALYGFKTILDDNARSYNFMETMTKEALSFENYVRNNTVENKEIYDRACARTKQSIRFLSYDYEKIGQNRYGKTWSIRNGYETYEKQRDAFLAMKETDSRYIDELYEIYRIQEYLKGYAGRLVEDTLKEGNLAYQDKVPMLYRLPFLIMVVGLALIGMSLYLSAMMNRSLIQPVVRLAHASRKIARNDFTEPDLEVFNRDEVGELVRAFNKMKHSTEGYIAMLEEKNEVTERLHQEEMAKIEVEKRLDATNLELLKSQINPHFLFNTLNMIGCMAKLEDAGTTEQMTVSLSNLFRYNLKTPEAVVILEQELKVVRDYMYLQQMRFGERIQYDIESHVDTKSVMVPAFTFQPLVENAIVHGISKKEEGGGIWIKIKEQGKNIVISVADTGVGMETEALEGLREALKSRATANVGIGVGNIYKRIHAMYQDGEFQIYSRKGRGTVVRMVIPQESFPEEESDVPDFDCR